MRASSVPNLFFEPGFDSTQAGLAGRYPLAVWLLVVSAFAVAHLTLFMWVHNLVDTRPCAGYSPDPLLQWIPNDPRWFLVTRQIYLVGILISVALFAWQAARGTETPLLRWGLALSLSTILRSATVILIPLCRSTIVPGGPPPLATPSSIHLLSVAIPWRSFALNDLVYSGHTALFFLVYRAAGGWNRQLRLFTALFLAVMIYGLIATRGHYSVDILLAFPCAAFADNLATSALRRFARRRSVHSRPSRARARMQENETVCQ